MLRFRRGATRVESIPLASTGAFGRFIMHRIPTAGCVRALMHR